MEFTKLQRIKAVILALAATLATTSCGSSGGGSSEGVPELLRVINAAPDLGPLTATIDGQVIASGLEYGTGSEYIDAPEGEGRELRIRGDDDVLPVIDEDLTIETGKSSSAFAIEEEGEVVLLQIEDTPDQEIDPGQFLIRFVNAAEDVASADIYVTFPDDSVSDEDPITTELEFKGSTAYIALDEGEYRLRATTTGTNTVLVNAGVSAFEAGKMYTFVVLEKENGGSPFISVLLADD